jgi:replicative DNA helicase
MNHRQEIIQTTEQAVVGAVLYDPKAFGDVAGVVLPEHFSEIDLRRAWAALSEAFQAETGMDPVSISRSSGVDLDYLIDLSGMVGTTANISHHARMVVDEDRRRRVAIIGRSLVESAGDTARTAADVLEEAHGAISDMANRVSSGGLVETTGDITEALKSTEEAFRAGGMPIGPTTGLPAVDRCIMGFKPSTMNILAARPSQGKTALALNIAAHEAKRGGRVAFFSLEMPRNQHMHRLLACESMLNVAAITHGKITASQWPTYMAASERVSLWSENLLIDDSGTMTPMMMRAAIRRASAKKPLTLVVVDYLQLMSGGGKFSNRQEEVASVSRKTKALAMDLHLPVLALSQLSRDSEKRTDKMPQLTDLRESGALEQDADSVTFIHRPEDKTIIFVAKNRNGATGIISNKIRFLGEFTKFVEVEERDDIERGR